MVQAKFYPYAGGKGIWTEDRTLLLSGGVQGLGRKLRGWLWGHKMNQSERRQAWEFVKVKLRKKENRI